MEKISAACCMEWSIELEKGLRSNNPGRRIEVIEQTGHRLQQWSTEPGITLGVSNMYGLVPGEDRLFANTILLRLADAFRCGDINTKKIILKIFLVESKHLIKEGRRYNGILSKQRVPNYLELLRRVKTVFDTSDVEAKCLALRLFGCWADLAKDSVQIRYMILLSLQSSHVSEVKASLFAVGCFCILSEDFACIALEILIAMISSTQTLSDVKLEAIRSFSKMRCSFSRANKAYKMAGFFGPVWLCAHIYCVHSQKGFYIIPYLKAGKTLMPSLQEDELKAEMLSSLSKLTINSSVLVLQQVDLLLSYASNDCASLFRARALKCLYFLFSRGASLLAFERNVLSVLLGIMDDKKLSPIFHCGALQILQKVLCIIFPDPSHTDTGDLFRLVLLVKNATESSVRAERCLAIHLLVDIVCSLKGAIREQWSSSPEKSDGVLSKSQSSGDICDGDGPTLLVCHVITVISDQMHSLAKRLSVESGGALSEAKQEFRSLLNLILRIVSEYPALSHSVLIKIQLLIQVLVSVKGKMENSDISKLLLWTCRFTIAVLNLLGETRAFDSEVCHITKSLVECLNQNGSYSFDTYEILSFNIRLFMFNCHTKNKISGMDSEESTVVNWACLECRVLELIKNMIKVRNYWSAYRAGVYACCEGVWFSAAFSFRKLMDILQSDQCRSWIRSLILLAGSESEIKLLLFPKVGTKIISFMQNEKDWGDTFSSIERDLNEYGGQSDDLYGCKSEFVKIYNRVRTSEENLASFGANGVYYFQRWFLSVRAKVLKIFVDMLDLLSSHAFTEEKLVVGLHTKPALACGFAGLSLRLNNIAKEYDLLSVSFLDIDYKSFTSISRQALGCSVLAFCTSFALYSINSPAFKNTFSSSVGEMIKISQITVLKDLIERLWNLDEVETELQQLMAVCIDALNTMQLGTERNHSLVTDEASFLLYKCMIVDVLRIQEDSKGVEDEEGLHQYLLQGLQLLSAISQRWIDIPSLLPRYFFRIRPCIGAELFIFSAAPNSTTELSAIPGSKLSLNLCLQLKNAASNPHVQITKIYCILAVCQSDCKKREKQPQCGFQAHETDEMIELYDVLLRHITSSDRKISKENFDIDGSEFVTSFVCLEPNKMGQGFSTCLIDVSSFPEGSYAIKWKSCCNDKNGRLWSPLSLNAGAVITIKKS